MIKRKIVAYVDNVRVFDLAEASEICGLKYHTLYRRFERRGKTDCEFTINGKVVKIEVLNKKNK